ncbi:hypothetical protein AN639_03815 [Candidatus Epulonipiscium fishelsonii]|uniref:Uncharacterized protein n=1 Tax=Candidatus Epulonipiscium fishelsonii TaxID=77094 RepID=A0ACC8XAK6_9FIRM|nr:hypothetical protein AN396_08565 [Epulopiscium sp. SCG-B11WGA-EpuloA1]ONI41188.1 hypothetical protein AN639_03815 [Epulopiscium sp. SCG-B05WGA-EpuloA1]
MNKIDFTHLNKLETEIYNKLFNYVQNNGSVNIIEAADLCNVSTSKISKSVKKLGFNTYKEFIRYCTGEPSISQTQYYSNELERIKLFIEDFDINIVNHFVEQLNKYNKIILHGLGPSFIVAQYFEYKLRVETTKYVVALENTLQIENLVDNNTLFIIFSVEGTFSLFHSLIDLVGKNQGTVFLILEGPNNTQYKNVNNVLFLTQHLQSSSLLSYQKTRSVFFIFIEEIMLCLMQKK